MSIAQDTINDAETITATTSESVSARASMNSSSRTSGLKPKRSTSWLRHSSSRRKSESFTSIKTDTCPPPFMLKWSYGITLGNPVINLTNKERSIIFYSASHAGILYDYISREMHPLQAHKNLISSTSASENGKWIVTADGGQDNSITVWDSFQYLPVNTIFDAHPNYGIMLVKISPKAKYLVSIGNERIQVVKFWLWTYGQKTCNDSITLKNIYGKPVKITFNPNVEEHFMISCEKQVLFFMWNRETKKIVEHHVPDIKTRRGLITSCTYVDKCHECFASTTEGNVLVFGRGPYFTPYEQARLCNEKVYTKTLKVSTCVINCIESCEGLIATGDINGNIRFYDKMMRIMYWCQNFALPSITSLSFCVEPRKFKIKDADSFNDLDFQLEEIIENEFDDKSEEYEQLFTELVPSDATLERLPFVVRDFIVGTADGSIASIDYIRNRCSFLFRKADSHVIAIDVHSEDNYICIAYENGIICLYNYISRELITSTKLPEDINYYTNEVSVIAALKYSPESLHLVCAKDNGGLWFLDSVALTPKNEEPYFFTAAKIIKFVFSEDSRYLAYYDENSTVCLIKHISDSNTWHILGKLRSHYKNVNDILFTPYLPSRLFTIGNDRSLVEYDIIKSETTGSLEVISTERIEQTALPVAFIYYPKDDCCSQRYIFMSDNQFKYKKLHDITLMCRAVILGPAYGCYQECPVNKMEILPQHKDAYMVYANHKHIGLQLLPIDGNPYKYIGLVGHPVELLQFKVCREGKYLFTIGRDDPCVLMWDINVKAADTMARIGGNNLEPFYSLLEGGLNGWLFKEMQDLFYYMQILHQDENTVLPRIVTDTIPVSELPDLMRACGFYPTEYEIETLLVDIKYRNFDKTQKLQDEISFYDFVKLYINHRPAHGITIENLRENFNAICMVGQSSRRDCISGPSFITAIRERGEYFSLNNAHKCLSTLMHYEMKANETKDFSFLPDEIDFETFLDEILGMDLERQAIEENDTDEVEENVEHL